MTNRITRRNEPDFVARQRVKRSLALCGYHARAVVYSPLDFPITPDFPLPRTNGRALSGFLAEIRSLFEASSIPGQPRAAPCREAGEARQYPILPGENPGRVRPPSMMVADSACQEV